MSTFLNIKNQYNTLKLAENKNEELKLTLEKMKILKLKMTKQVEYATSSAFLDQQRKQLFGLGTENDVWLDLPEERKIAYDNGIVDVTETPKYRQWLNLFTQ